MATTRYLPHIIYTTAIISISTHALDLRKLHEEHRVHYETYISLLESTVNRLKAGEVVPERDFDRLRNLAKEPESDRAAARGLETKDEIGWWEVVFGRKRPDMEHARQRSEELDKRDLEKSMFFSQYHLCDKPENSRLCSPEGSRKTCHVMIRSYPFRKTRLSGDIRYLQTIHLFIMVPLMLYICQVIPFNYYLRHP